MTSFIPQITPWPAGVRCANRLEGSTRSVGAGWMTVRLWNWCANSAAAESECFRKSAATHSLDISDHPHAHWMLCGSISFSRTACSARTSLSRSAGWSQRRSHAII